jgi:hypothetical protein
MQPFQVPGQSASRHDPQIAISRAVPIDPYAAWLERREADSRSSSTTRPLRRFVRGQSSKAPWEAIVVTLSADGR